MGLRKARLCFLGKSHAAVHLRQAAIYYGFAVTEHFSGADLAFVSEDTPIDAEGNRDQRPIHALLESIQGWDEDFSIPVVVTSQVDQTFLYGLDYTVYLQTELLRMSDARARAINPEMMIVGCDHNGPLDAPYAEYLEAFQCPILRMARVEAVFAKIAINMALATQVDYANKMKAACDKIGADWSVVREAVHLDSRIGPNAYLTPGRWQDSLHLLRDYVTLQQIEARK